LSQSLAESPKKGGDENLKHLKGIHYD